MSKHKKFLFSGQPPLKLSTAKSIQEMIEKALETNFTDEQVKLFQKRLIIEWQEGKKTRRDINKSETMAEEILGQIQALPIEKQPFAWREFGRQIYIYAENEGKTDPIGQLILTLYERKNLLLIKGNPPLSRQAAESYAEMATFTHNVLNKTLIVVDDKQKEEIINELIKNFSSHPLEQQEQISQADALWGQLRYNWKLASDEEKESFKKEIQSYLSKQPIKELEPKLEIAQPIESKKSDEKLSDKLDEKVQENLAPETISTPEEPANKTTQSVKALPQKFFDVVNRLRAKVGKSVLIPNKPSDQ
ncbi:MAG: hypothetical protein HY819_13955 [Acidobacteria bacterium]|nr:hypothetical protein [Acidobacteriota bacterium]